MTTRELEFNITLYSIDQLESKSSRKLLNWIQLSQKNREILKAIIKRRLEFNRKFQSNTTGDRLMSVYDFKRISHIILLQNINLTSTSEKIEFLIWYNLSENNKNVYKRLELEFRTYIKPAFKNSRVISSPDQS